MTTSRILTVLALFLTASALHAQKPYVYDFLRNDASARSAAMGGSFLTIGDDPAGLYYNPALLNTIDTTRVSFTFFKHLLDINSGFATIATTMEEIGHVAVGVNFNNYGAFERTDKTGQAIGEFGSSDIALTLGWGSMLGDGFSAGVSGTAVYSGIDDVSSAALSLGGGLLYSDTARRFNAGLSVLHLGSQVSTFGGVTEDLPLDLKLGVSHELRGLPLNLAVTFSRLLDPTENFFDRFQSFAVGGEFRLSKPLRLRLGYNNQVRRDIAFGASKGLGGLSAGLGILIKDYRIDYAFNGLARLGALHRVTINATF